MRGHLAVKSVVPNLVFTVLTVLTALFSLPLLALYFFAFFAIGGGWSLGTNDCHFVIGPIGYLMLGPPIFLVGSVGRLIFRKIRPLY